MIRFGVGLLLVLLPLATTTRAGEKQQPVEYLFVQNAEGVSVDQQTLTLEGAGPTTMFFTDRPERIAGHLALDEFLAVWKEGENSFADDPPNATLSILDGEAVRSVVVELTKPRLEGRDLTFDVRVLSGEVPAKGGPSSLFIDGLLGAGIHGAALGAIGGAIGGDTGKGAKIGAGVAAGSDLLGRRRAAYRW